MVNLDKIENTLKEYRQAQSTKWEFGNQIMYDMCANNLSHADKDIIVGKIWIIGRTYAAAIERTKNIDKKQDDFYYNVVAEKLFKVGAELDKRINYLNQYNCPSRENMKEILNTHKWLVDVFYTMTNIEKRSLASKYLHFHCPKLFYIYDSRAKSGIMKLVNGRKSKYKVKENDNSDLEYAKFCWKMLEFQEEAQQLTDIELTPRILDDILLYHTN